MKHISENEYDPPRRRRPPAKMMGEEFHHPDTLEAFAECGRRVRELRQLMGLSPEDVCRRCGIGIRPWSVRQVEIGKLTQQTSYYDVARGLGVKFHRLWGTREKWDQLIVQLTEAAATKDPKPVD